MEPVSPFPICIITHYPITGPAVRFNVCEHHMYQDAFNEWLRQAHETRGCPLCFREHGIQTVTKIDYTERATQYFRSSSHFNGFTRDEIAAGVARRLETANYQFGQGQSEIDDLPPAWILALMLCSVLTVLD